MNFFKDVIIWLALIFPKKCSGMANLFYESGLFEFASPSLSGAGNVDCINEPLFEAGSLWHLGNNLTNHMSMSIIVNHEQLYHKVHRMLLLPLLILEWT